MQSQLIPLLQRANSSLQQGDWQSAQAHLQQALRLQASNFDALHLMGMCQGMRGETTEAIKYFRKALKVHAGNCFVHFNLGKALHDTGRYQDALAHHEAGLQLAARHVPGWVGRGLALHALHRYEEAVASFEQALRIEPRFPEAWVSLGNSLCAIGKWEPALHAYDQALALNPQLPGVWSNRGNALKALRRHLEALDSVDRALSLTGNFAEAWSNRGNILQELGRFQEALESFKRALALSPDYAQAWANQGNTQRLLKDFAGAAHSYAEALKLDSSIPWLAGDLLNVRMAVCDWQDFAEACGLVRRKVQAAEPAMLPFAFLAIESTPQEQLRCAQTYAQEKFPPRAIETPSWRHRPGEKIRIGYYSADLHNHATSYLMAGLFEAHDRSRFEVIGFSIGPSPQDEMRARLAKAFDGLIDVSAESDLRIVEMSREMGIDIAVDLKGYTRDCRPNIFAMRAAPVQVNYLGYPGSMGVPYMDYIVGDAVVTPQAHKDCYAEKIVQLPGSYQVNDARREVSGAPQSRQAQGLPEQGLVFCCFNNNYKITPDVFAVWMRVLGRVEGSVLWLLEDNALAAANLRQQAVTHGVEPSRLVFATRAPLAEHLARQCLADLFLDTFHYNAHTTASDALWVGLPVLTRLGPTFPSRVAASLLTAVGLPELIAGTSAEYEALALSLASEPARLATLRDKLQRQRLSAPLFDTNLFARHLEQAYEQMMERCRQGLPPEHLHVS